MIVVILFLLMFQHDCDNDHDCLLGCRLVIVNTNITIFVVCTFSTTAVVNVLVFVWLVVSAFVIVTVTVLWFRYGCHHYYN